MDPVTSFASSASLHWLALNLGYKIPNNILQISLFILLNDDWQITITVWEERKIRNFLKIFPSWRGEERDGYVDLASGHYCGPRVCLLGWFCNKIPAREREMSSVNVNTIPARHRNHPPLSWKISKNNLEI